MRLRLLLEEGRVGRIGSAVEEQDRTGVSLRRVFPSGSSGAEWNWRLDGELKYGLERYKE